MTHNALTRIFQNRLLLLALLIVLQAQFFVINGLNSILRDPTDGWELKIGFIDNHLTPESLWLIPYTFGFFAAALVPIWAAYNMPIKLYRQYIVGMAVAALFSYAIYIVFPTYVTKPSAEQVRGNHLLASMLRDMYQVDAAASSHNAAPSQHVFYAILNTCFLIRFRPNPRVFWTWVTMGVLITVSTIFTMRHNSPDMITGYLVAVGAYYTGVRLGARITDRLGDEHKRLMPPPLPWHTGGRRRRAGSMSADSV